MTSFNVINLCFLFLWKQEYDEFYNLKKGENWESGPEAKLSADVADKIDDLKIKHQINCFITIFAKEKNDDRDTTYTMSRTLPAYFGSRTNVNKFE